jgi:hypothetical protein
VGKTVTTRALGASELPGPCALNAWPVPICNKGQRAHEIDAVLPARVYSPGDLHSRPCGRQWAAQQACVSFTLRPPMKPMKRAALRACLAG